MQMISGIGKWMFCLSMVAVTPFPSAESLHAQDFPTKPINLVIPYGAGGASDLSARAFINTSTKYLGQPIIIQIKPGGGGAIGSEMVAQAKPDGYTLLMGHTNCNTVLPAVEGRETAECIGLLGIARVAGEIGDSVAAADVVPDFLLRRGGGDGVGGDDADRDCGGVGQRRRTGVDSPHREGIASLCGGQQRGVIGHAHDTGVGVD